LKNIYLSPALFVKFIKFCLVGFSGMVIDFSITFILKEKLKVQKYVANSTGFIAAASTNYLFNRLWTFQSRNPNIANEYFHFIIISVTGLVINNLILWIQVSKFKWNFYFSKLVAIMITSIWNFIANILFTF
jgi:putative flippase GtrA